MSEKKKPKMVRVRHGQVVVTVEAAKLRTHRIKTVWIGPQPLGRKAIEWEEKA